MFCILFFLFKQKTAYEMRISDWSSDVCSSDLPKFGDQVLSKFMNSVMIEGKKSVAESIVYGALDTVEARAKREPIQVFHEALNNVKPGIDRKSTRLNSSH